MCNFRTRMVSHSSHEWKIRRRTTTDLTTLFPGTLVSKTISSALLFLIRSYISIMKFIIVCIIVSCILSSIPFCSLVHEARSSSALLSETRQHIHIIYTSVWLKVSIYHCFSIWAFDLYSARMHPQVWNHLAFVIYLFIVAALADDGKFLLAARKYRKPTCTEYTISLDADGMSKGGGTCIGKLRYVLLIVDGVSSKA